MMNDKWCMAEEDEIDETLKSIAQMLVAARAPLIYGLTQLTVEAQELAVELAMCLRGAIDTPHGSRIPPRGTSLQLHGEARTTLGELRLYADLLVYVHAPAKDNSPPFSLTHALASQANLPGKRIIHICMMQDGVRPVPKQDQKDLLVHADSGSFSTKVRELDCRNEQELFELRKKLAYRELTHDADWEQLLRAWQEAKYPVLAYEPSGLTRSLGSEAAAYLIEQIERAALARAKFGRAAAWPLEAHSGGLSNAAGAEYVLTARTGYPASVQCFSGCAEFLPGMTNAEALLADGVIDAVLFLGEGPSADWSAAALQHLQKIPTATIASSLVLQGKSLLHKIECNSLSEEQGTIVREDGIPISLDSSGNPESSAASILRQLLAIIREPSLQGAAR